MEVFEKKSYTRIKKTVLSRYHSRRILITGIATILLISLNIQAFAQQAPLPPVGAIAGQPKGQLNQLPEPGLLFYLSGDHNVNADFAAGGQTHPNFIKNVHIIPDGTKGAAFHEDDWPLMSYWAPANIYAQRGTVSFFWRSGYPVGPTQFPIFRVGDADNTSWDMVWLRIDYNGSGFDAFVTDVGLARTRVSYYMSKFPKPKQWTHIAFSWDETKGVKLYINGKLVAEKSVQDKVYDTSLGQFGPTSRTISPMQVQSRYNFIRGGDYDEFRIYDRMLSDKDIAELAHNKIPKEIPSGQRDLSKRRWRREWWLRHGWNLPNKPPTLLPSSDMTIKKVEIHDATDVKRRMWKANDGIRETTWPGVYNMSTLPGRFDYFVLPDWDCYSVSGQTIKFKISDEPWNHIEMWGTAWGQLTYMSKDKPDYTFGVRTKEQIKSYQQLKKVRKGGIIRFDNAIQERPIGEFGVYYVHQGHAPTDRTSETFTLEPAPSTFTNPGLKKVAAFIDGRYPADEREKMIGVPGGMKMSYKAVPNPEYAHPLIHILIPYINKPDTGLDGVEIHIPALNVKPTHGDLFPMEIRIKDPLWPMQDLTDYSFSIKPGKSYTLWFNTRNRILPKGKALYITLAGAGADLTPQLLKGAKIKLIYLTKKQAKKEDIADRLTQIEANYAFSVEEYPMSSRFNLFNRFMADYNDLIKLDPNNWLAKAYIFAEMRNKPKYEPKYKIPSAPPGVPEWAFLQVQYLKQLEKVVSYYIDKRQISNGEMGGGLSDDDDLTNVFAATAFLGIKPDKTLKSLRLLMTAFYDQDRPAYDAPLRQPSLPLFTNGLATNQYDQLHAYEDGIELLGQLELLDYANPLYINRGMETDNRILNYVTQINPKGYRLFRSRDYSGTKMSTEDPWQWSGHYSYNMLHTSYMTVRYNGNPHLQKMIVQLADALLAHRKNGRFYTSINFSTDSVRGRPGLSDAWQVFQAAYDYTGDTKYLNPVKGMVKTTRAFKPDSIVAVYKKKIRYDDDMEYLNTKGSAWIDRSFPGDFNSLQEDRLGGVALRRDNDIYPENYVSWKINKPADYTSMAFFLLHANSKNIKIIAYNLDKKEVSTQITTWKVAPGEWRITEGLDTNNDQKIDSQRSVRTVELERGKSIRLSFAPRKYTIVELELIKPAKTGYW